jgi:predicted GNAT family acetyltransferase
VKWKISVVVAAYRVFAFRPSNNDRTTIQVNCGGKGILSVLFQSVVHYAEEEHYFAGIMDSL